MPRCLPSFLALACFLVGVLPLSASDEKFWSFVPPRKSNPPEVKHKDRVVTPIDAFILARLEAQGLTLNPPADRLTLLRRVTYDLTGLPPTLAEQEAFLKDSAPDAYRKVVDRLLASPRYGERWAQHWLDLVRYAESDGFKADVHRPLAHQYRDYVIRAFNEDLPYDRFVRQQLAGDELEPDNPQALIATGLNRLWPDEDNAANLEQRRQEILDDVTDTMGSVFLGLTIGCARCHDHKYDPTTQSDYYQLQAFFAAMLPRNDLLALAPAERRQYEKQYRAWEQASAKVRQEMDSLVGAARKSARAYLVQKFDTEIQTAVRTPLEQRTPYQMQIAAMAERQLQEAENKAPAKLTGEKKERYQQLQKELAALNRKRPDAAHAMGIVDLGRQAPPTHRLMGGNWRRPREEVEPGFPLFLGTARPDTALPRGVTSTGRRAALARWLTAKDHPLTARVMVNRLWQHHFGVGLVASASDFGTQGELPSHPPLLDWLAVEFIERGWSLKQMHREMVLSSTYTQSASIDPQAPGHQKALKCDGEDRLLWHARRRRLEGEAIRDASLLLAGELNLRMYGPSAKPILPAEIGPRYAWTPDPKAEDQNRRSIYVMAKRNMRYPLFDVFDLPDQHNSCSRRSQTTTAPQALLMLNGEFTQTRAQRWSEHLLEQSSGDPGRLVKLAYRQAWGREATSEEIRLGVAFVEKQAQLLRAHHPATQATALRVRGSQVEAPVAAGVLDFCHALLNTNEFLYVD